VKPKTIKLIFVASPLSTQHKEKKSKDWLAQNQVRGGSYQQEGIIFICI
jgi:hypothetical protein